MADDDIIVLPGLEAVRRRPGMYVGALDELCPNRLLREALCCARDDALAGTCDRAHVTLRAGGVASVRDWGPGLPLTRNSSGQTIAHMYFTVMSACSRAKRAATPESTCTFGLAALNALSASMIVRVFQDGNEWEQRYARGHSPTDFALVGAASDRGTEMTLTLDAAILPWTEFNFTEMCEWARSAVTALHLTIDDARTGESATVAP